MHDHRDAEEGRRPRQGLIADELGGARGRREPEAPAQRTPEEPGERLIAQGGLWRWHLRRRRER